MQAPSSHSKGNTRRMADFLQPLTRRIRLRADTLRTPAGTGEDQVVVDLCAPPAQDAKAVKAKGNPRSRNEWRDEYIEHIARYIVQHRIRSIVDVGVGDFRMGRSLLARLSRLKWDVTYTGVDAVESFIEVHMSAGHRPGVFFAYCDVLRDALPKADLCLIGQLLTHMSNSAVSTVLAKADRFAHVIVAESHSGVCDLAGADGAANARMARRNGKGMPVFPNIAPFNRKYSLLQTIDMRDPAGSGEAGGMVSLFVKDAVRKDQVA